MSILLDTSVLVRLANTSDPRAPVAARVVAELRRRGEYLGITSQVLIEFRAVATRPTTANGLGFTTRATDRAVTRFEAQFPLLIETAGIYYGWKSIVSALGVVGKTVHDARLVAVCHVHAVTHLLTFNLSQFRTLATAPPGIVVLDPATV